MIEQWQIYLNYHQRMGILPLKKRVDYAKCSFATKLHMFGVFAMLSMRSFANEEAPFPPPALYATLDDSSSESQIMFKQRKREEVSAVDAD